MIKNLLILELLDMKYNLDPDTKHSVLIFKMIKDNADAFKEYKGQQTEK